MLAAQLYRFDWDLPYGVAPSELEMHMMEEMSITIRRKKDLYLRNCVQLFAWPCRQPHSYALHTPRAL